MRGVSNPHQAGFLPGELGSLTPRLVPRAPTSPKAVRKLRHHSEVPSKEVLPLAALPLWVGTATCEEVPVKSIKAVVPEDLHQHEDVSLIDEAEADASFCSAHERFVEAAENLEQAISIRQQLLGDDHEEFLRSIESYVASCNNWSVQCLARGSFTAALELLKKAEAMTEADNVPNYQRRVVLRAVTFNNLCCYYRSRGKQNAALQFAERCLKIEQHYKDGDNLARTYLNYAVLLSTTGRSVEALEQIEKALAALHDREREAEETAETSQMLVVAHYNMFVEYLRLKQSGAGLQCLQKAVQVAARKLNESHTLTKKMREVQMDVEDRLQQKAFAEKFRTSAGNFEVSDIFMHFQDHEAHPWRKVTLDETDSERAQEILSHAKQITLRCRRPAEPPPPERPLRPRPRYLKTHQVAMPEVPSRWWESHPKLLHSDGFAGSPMLCQQAHGVQPMLETRRSSPRTTGNSWAGDARLRLPEIKSPEGKLVPSRVRVPPGAPPEVVAAAEYHLRRLQLQGDVTALEPERMRAICVFRDRLDTRREMGLPIPTDGKKHQAATKIQARIRGFLIRQWTLKELAWELRRQRALEESICDEGILDGKRKAAFRVIYAARRAFVEYSAAVRIQKLVRGAIVRMKLRKLGFPVGAMSGVASDRLTVACAKAHKGGDANANKVALCEAPPRLGFGYRQLHVECLRESELGEYGNVPGLPRSWRVDILSGKSSESRHRQLHVECLRESELGEYGNVPGARESRGCVDKMPSNGGAARGSVGRSVKSSPHDLVAIDGWQLTTLVTRGLPAGRLALPRLVMNPLRRSNRSSSVSAEASARQVACEQLQKELKEDVLLKAELAQQVSEDLRGALRDEANEREELRSRLEQHVSHTREALDEMKLRFEKREAELADRVREAEEAQREELRSSKAKQLGIEEGLDELRRALAAEGSERRNAFEGIVARLQHLEASVGDEGVAREEEQRQVLRELSSALAKLQEEKADREEAIAKITQSMAEQAALLEDSLDKEAKAREASVAQAVVHLQKDLKTEGATREEMLRSTATKLQQLSSELQQEREDRSRFLRDVNASLAKLQRMQAEAAEADTRAQENDRLVVALEPQEAMTGELSLIPECQPAGIPPWLPWSWLSSTWAVYQS
ncbi:unnamed protein product [Durusdinium trenchii]|uniref:Uncharacterized protein n=1 Tax=Durusdinium trenchii TaxID=1381693 RepID=A0ABP0P2E2_9DINO